MNIKHLHEIPESFVIIDSPRDRGKGSHYGWGANLDKAPCREVWRPVERYFKHHRGKFPTFEEIKIMPGYYLISSDGRLYSLAHGKFICNSDGDKRRETKLVTADGDLCHVKISRLVLDNFLEPPDAARTWIRHYFEAANHINAKKWDDALVNVEYTNAENNNLHFVEVGKPNRTEGSLIK